MSPAVDHAWWSAALVALLLMVGGVIAVTGAVGLARLENFYQRMHGPAITVTLGAGCLLLASMVHFTVIEARLVIHELLITVFILMTAPVVSMLIMRTGVYRELSDQSKETSELTKLESSERK